jgi:hypothetical protein
MSIGIDFTVTAIINDAKLRASMPSAQPLFQEPDFVTLINNHMISIVIPLIKSVNEEYFVIDKDVPLVAGQNAYTIPSRALGGALRDVVLVDAAGNEQELARVAPEVVKGNTGSASGIYLKDDQVVFHPALSNPPAVYIRFKYERRPNDLCIVSLAGKINSVDTVAKTITLASKPSSWTSSTTFDIIQPVPQFKSIIDDMAVMNIVGNVLTVAALPAGIAAGQYIAESMRAPIAQLPYEAHKLLAQLGAISLLESMKDSAGLRDARDTYGEMEEKFMKVITPRIEGAPKKAVNRKSIFNFTGF